MKKSKIFAFVLLLLVSLMPCLKASGSFVSAEETISGNINGIIVSLTNAGNEVTFNDTTDTFLIEVAKMGEAIKLDYLPASNVLSVNWLYKNEENMKFLARDTTKQNGHYFATFSSSEMQSGSTFDIRLITRTEGTFDTVSNGYDFKIQLKTASIISASSKIRSEVVSNSLSKNLPAYRLYLSNNDVTITDKTIRWDIISPDGANTVFESRYGNEIIFRPVQEGAYQFIAKKTDGTSIDTLTVIAKQYSNNMLYVLIGFGALVVIAIIILIISVKSDIKSQRVW